MFSISRIKRLICQQQNKPCVNLSNKIRPQKIQFKSTKDLFEYSKKRCVDALNLEKPYEHALIVDTKKNIVISEYVGDSKKCKLEDLNHLDLDKKNTAIIHGHPDSAPISTVDIKTMLDSGVYQVVAFNSRGEFSIVSRTPCEVKNINKKLMNLSMDAYNEHPVPHTLYNPFMHSMLSKHMPLMGLRYVSNYKCLK